MAIAVILLYLLALRCRLHEAQSTNPLFEMEPMDAVVEIGSNVSFQCMPANKQECNNVQWVQSKTSCASNLFATLASCRTTSLIPSTDTSRFSATFNENDNTAGFSITNVNVNDTGYYACWLYYLVDHSKCARLTVVQPPTPQCSSSPSNPRVGETVTLDCRVPATAAIPAKLTWHWETSSRVKLTQTITPGMSFQKEHILKETDNFKSFTCVAGNDIDAGPRCSVYPLQINMTVSVVLLQNYEPNDIDGITLELKCDAKSIPATTRHTWSLLSNTNLANGTESEWTDVTITQGRYKLTDSGRCLHIVNATQKDDGMKVRCLASNDIMSVTSKPVTILHCADTDKFVFNVTQCRVTSMSPRIEAQSYVGIVVVYFIAFLAIISVIVHIVIIKREKKALTTQLELTERHNQ